MSILFMTTSAYSQSWKDGKSKLMRGDYKGAESSLSKAFAGSRSAADKAETLKFLGVSQFMLNKQPQAAQSFKAALKLNPKLKLTDNDVADESVIPFFNKQRGGSANAGKAVAKAPPKVAPLRGPIPKGGKTGVSSAKSNKTLVKVMSNVDTAQVSMDGIAYGRAGNDIEVSPGTVVLEISAAGYISKSIKITVAPKTANTVTVDLEKPKPKVVAKKPAAPKPSGKPASAAKNKGDDLFATEEGSADDFNAPVKQAPGGLALPSVTSPAQQAQAVTPPSAPQNPMLPQGAYMQQQPMYQAQPMYQQPMYQQPMYMQPQPMYQQPMYAPPQPMYQQPMYSAPPPYANPYGGYAPQAPPSVYSPYGASAAPVGPPQFDPYATGSQPLPPIDPPVASAPATSAAPPVAAAPPGSSIDSLQPPPLKPPKSFASGGKKKSSKSSGGDCSTFIKILPFGAGQFCQGSTLKGLVVAGAQIGGLYYYKQNTDSAASLQSKMSSYSADRETGRASASDQTEYDNTTASGEAEYKTVIAKAKENASMSLMVFGGAWAVGVVDAVAFGPKPKKSSKKARLSLMLPQANDPRATLAFATPFSSLEQNDAQWYAGYSPDLHHASAGSVRFGVTLEL